jgi:4-hydroxybenzoate polyprenyltransferase
MSAEAFSGLPARAPAERAVTRTLRLLRSCIRFDEVLVLQAAPLLGVLFSIGTPTVEKVGAVALFLAGSCCLVAHVYVLNDWSGMYGDLNDPHRTRGVFAARGVERSTMAALCAGLLALTVALLWPFGGRTVALALAIAGLSAVYSRHVHPGKGVPVLSSLLHLAGGALHFHLGYSVFGAFEARSVAISIFFALMFAAGHLTQETRDYDADLANGIRTNAVTFGRARGFLAGLALFTSADVLLAVLALRGGVPRTLLLVVLLYPVHLWWSVQALRAGLTFESVRRLRRRYRWLYALIGLLALAAVVAR